MASSAPSKDGEVGMAEVLVDDGEAREAALGEDAHVGDQAADAPGGEGAAGEAEQEDLVADVPVVGEKRIGLADVLRQTNSQTTAE